MRPEKLVLRIRPSLGILATLATASTIAGVAAISNPHLGAIAKFKLAATGTQLTDWRFDPAASQLEINLNKQSTPRYFLLSQPPRIVLDLPNTQMASVDKQESYAGIVQQIRVSQFQPDVTRIVLELSPEVLLGDVLVQLQPSETASVGNRWILRSLIADSRTSAAPDFSTTLPPANFRTPQTSRVQVPPISSGDRPTGGQEGENSQVPLSTLPQTATASTLPPATFKTNRTASISVPPLKTATATTRVIEFGQPLPGGENTPVVPAVVSRVSNSQPVVERQALPSSESSISKPQRVAVVVPRLVPRVAPLPNVTAAAASIEPALPSLQRPSSVSPVRQQPTVAVAPLGSRVAPRASVTATMASIEFGVPLPSSPRPGGVSSRRQRPTVVVPPLAPKVAAVRERQSRRSNIDFEAPVQPKRGAASARQRASVVVPPLGSRVSTRRKVTAAQRSRTRVALGSPKRQSVAKRRRAKVVAQRSRSRVTPQARSIARSRPGAEALLLRQTNAISTATLFKAEFPDVLLPEGAVLSLIYPGKKPLTMKAGTQRQEVLLLTEAIRDRSGQIVVPAGSHIIGRFETNSRGSRFIAQAIALGSRNVPISAESEVLKRKRRLSPNQILQVQLKEDLR